MRVALVGVILLALACSSTVVADTDGDPAFPGGASANESTDVRIDATPSAALTNERVSVRAVNLSAINATPDAVFVSWDFDDDGLADATGQHATWTYDEPGTYAITIFTTDGETDRVVRTNVTVSEGVAPVVSALPRDLDGDRLYEDVDGDGETTVQDVFDYHANRKRDVVRNQSAAFDFDGDGTAGTVFDTVKLYRRIVG